MGTYPGNSPGRRFIPACPAGRRVGSGRKNTVKTRGKITVKKRLVYDNKNS
jgi:hypothetical protein